MTSIAGLGLLLGAVFGGYMLAGGKFGIIMHALPFEMMIIGGAAAGAFIMANSLSDVKHTLSAIGKSLKGARFRKQDYLELLSLLYFLVRLVQTKGPMALEPHIEKPDESTAFQKFPKLAADHHATHLICDYLRMVGMNADDPHQIEDVMARELKKIHQEELHASHALQSVADALPALGIVAAVLGVIKTMASIDQPPAVLGAMIGGALVGTFLGVLLAYGLVGPFASRLKGVVDEESKYFEVIRAVLVAHLHGNAPQVAVETGRKMVPSDQMPSFPELEQALQDLVIA
ncbi:flagellar motor stator protein MotA [Plastoroseomonas hellenica]|uniref:Flagellar motor stator protein MotA n=1 Tax=Plastoroseomonas hellenica TaxID=2687306 RepID=A0ABS5EYF8_9PROT|nr:flagellar motor stator protein MotA [Plastoroseomonas hellenica]MBR0644537.1 flagellar motor stator protein MotA [Plastoroseomonas hellenica]MBR0665345.1 flagellar motor stator protein MotA [Plastoroseomonas hellenica]